MHVHIGTKAGETGLRQSKAWPHGAPFMFGVLTSFFAFNLLAPKRAGGDRWVVDVLTVAVKLDPAQKAEVRRIFAEARAQYAATPEKYQELRNHPQLEEIRRATRERVRALLRPEQKAPFDRWIQELNASRRRGESLRD
jgi:hypothetical protein